MYWIVQAVGSLVYSNSVPLNANFYTCIYLFIKYINLINKYMGFY